MTDQHRFDALSCMGNKVVRTPNIDRIANEGVRFDAAYTPCPVCAPARAALFSGQFPAGCGVTGNWVPFNGDAILLPEQLKNSGYTTGCVGKLHFVPHVKRWGFDYKQLHDAPYSVYADDDKYSDYIDYLRDIYGAEKADEFVNMFDEDESSFDDDLEQFIMGRDFIPAEHQMATWTADKSIDFMRGCDKDKPFFLFTSFFGPHHPWEVPPEWRRIKPEEIEVPELDADYSDKPIMKATHGKSIMRNRELFSEDDYKRIVASYYNQIEMIDYNIGRILDELHAQGKLENTMIVFTADHGDHNGHFGLFFKCTMLESSARVPLLLRPAGGCEPKVENTPVTALDIYGTLLEAGQVDHWQYDFIESGSLNSFLGADCCELPGDCFSVLGASSDNNIAMYRDGNLKLVRKGLGESRSPIYELYSLKDNQLETENLWRNSKYSEIARKMRRRLEEWCRKQDNPPSYPWRKG
jgi:arylsulfatase A-like enzyme